MKSKSYLSILSFTITIFSLPLSASAQKIGGGAYFSFSICNDSTLWMWGSNISGQLGIGNNADSNVPVQVNGLNGVTAVAAEGNHSIALKSDGSVWCWGLNTDGELGVGNSTNSNIPLEVTALTGIKSVAAGLRHCVAITSNNSIVTWGDNFSGQLGDGGNLDSYLPIAVSGISDVLAITAGANHSLALKNDGTVWAWGTNGNGQLGNGTNTDSNVPVQVSNLTGVIAITAYSAGSIALKNDGTVWTFGSNLYGLLGNGTLIPESNLPVQVSNLSGITAIAAGFSHSMALKNDGTVWAWGYNSAGELGNGTTQNETNIPLQVSVIAGVVAIGGGGTHALALQNDGRLFAWGYGYNGQIGNGTNLNENLLPVQINATCYPITTSLIENATTTSFEIYPNPAQDKIFMNGLTKASNIQIFDATGRLITTTTLMGNEGVDISHLTKGIYFVLVIGENREMVKGRFVKG